MSSDEEKRRRNRQNVARMRVYPPRKTPGSLGSHGMTGAEVLHLWKVGPKITEGRGPSEGGDAYRKFSYGKAARDG